MSEHTKLFERAGARYEPPDLRMEELLKRQDRKRRNQRIAAGVVGIAVFVAAIWIVTSVSSLDRSETSVVPGGNVTGPVVIGPIECPGCEAGPVRPKTGTWTGPCMDSQDGPPGQVCLGPLDEGTYASQRFEPALTFTVPAGWNNVWDTPGAFELWTPGWSGHGADQGVDCRSDPHPCGYLFDQPGLSVRHDPRPEQGCSGYADATVGTSAIEVATWVANHPAIATEAPSSVEVAGLTGYLLDMSLADNWRESCPGGPRGVWLFKDLYLSGFATARLILLDVPDGGSILIWIDGTQVDVAMPVVNSFVFDLG